MLRTKDQEQFADNFSESFPAVEVYFDYAYLPAETFLEVNRIILDAHDFFMNLFGLPGEEIFQWYCFAIKELRSGNSAIINFEFNFRFPDKTKKSAGLEKVIRRFAFVAGLFAAVIGGQEIYLNSLKIKEAQSKLERNLPPEMIRDAEKLNINLKPLMLPENQRYITSVKKNLAAAVSGDNIRSLQINGAQLKRSRPKVNPGSFDL